MSGDGAEKLGEKLMMEVEVEELNSVLKSLNVRLKNKKNFTTIPQLNTLLPSGPPILELISPPPSLHPSGAGKTSLLYLITASAILPSPYGSAAATILFDPLHNFSIPRLVSVMLVQLTSPSLSPSEKRNMVKNSLHHVHIFRPATWPALLSTLANLPSYLFDEKRHESINRCIHSLVLEDIDTFIPSIRSSSSQTPTSPNALATATTNLTTQLTHLATLLSCGIIITSHATSHTSFRPALPSFWPRTHEVTRFALRRVDVLKFAEGISVEEAEKERAKRWDVVTKGRFSVCKVGAREGEGFVFRVGERGVEVE